MLTEVKADIPTTEKMGEISYPADWGPNLLDPAHDGRIAAVSSNGAVIPAGFVNLDGIVTLNDGKATENYRWEPIWTDGDSYVIVELGRLATITRIRFDNPPRRDGSP